MKYFRHFLPPALTGFLLLLPWSVIEVQAAAGKKPTVGVSEESRKKPSPKPVALTDIKKVSDEKTVHLIFRFEGGLPQYKETKSKQDGKTLFSLNLNPVIMKDVEVPELGIPLSHMEIFRIEKWDIPQMQVHIYLEKFPRYRITQNKNEIRISFTRIASKALGKPVRLQKVNFKRTENNYLLMKFEFSWLPEVKSMFLTRKRNRAVLIFHNTILEGPWTSPPEVTYLSDFKIMHGVAEDSIPFVKMFFTSKGRLGYDTREDDYRFFADLYSEMAQEQWQEGKSDSVSLWVAPDSAAADISRTSEKEKSKSHKKWIYIGLGTGLIAGGTAAAVFMLNQPSPAPDVPAESEVNDIETDVILPDYPE